jgi:putative copper export protein
LLTVLAALARAGVFTAVVLLVGLAALRWFVLERPLDPTAGSRAAALGVLASALLVLALLGVFAGQLLSFNLPPDPLLPDARLLVGLPWGRVWTSQLALACLAAGAFELAARGSRDAWAVATAVALGLAFTPALSGHAIATEEARVLAVGADALHVLAAGSWLGTLGALAWTTARGGPTAAALLLARVRRFSPLALTSAAILVLSGTVGSWLHLTRLSDLWATSYGRWLSLKLVLFLAVAVFGFFNWRRRTPRLAEGGDAAGMRTSIAGELLLALAILVVTAFFVATPQPMGE